jgi:hypothetical protein
MGIGGFSKEIRYEPGKSHTSSAGVKNTYLLYGAYLKTINI